MNVSKKILLSISFICCFIIVIFILHFCRTPVLSYDKDVFINNKISYLDIANICYNDYIDNQNNNVICYGIDLNDNCIFIYSYNDNNKKILLTDTQINSAKNILSTYNLDHHTIDCIRVFDNFVTFGNINGRNSFIYSKNDTKPYFINFPNEDTTKLYIEKITNNWYYVCKQS